MISPGNIMSRTLRESPFNTFVSGEVFDTANDEAKTHNGKAMWEERVWKSGPVQRVFRSSWTWMP
jgi:hypothetical protein